MHLFSNIIYIYHKSTVIKMLKKKHIPNGHYINIIYGLNLKTETLHMEREKLIYICWTITGFKPH